MVFLGNPGTKYAATRHNAGFMAADAFEKMTGAKIQRLKYRALTAECTIGGIKTLLMKPQTYMNLSGEAVSQAARFYKISPERILVVSDDVALPPGKLRIRTKGSAGGHNGLKNIIEHLGTEEFPRIRIGVGAPPHPEYDMMDWVLSSFNEKEKKEILHSAEAAADAVKSYILDGPDSAMNHFN